MRKLGSLPSTNIDEEIAKSVVEILDDVKDKGDQALLERTLLYDKANLNKSELRVPLEDIKKATSLYLQNSFMQLTTLLKM